MRSGVGGRGHENGSRDEGRLGKGLKALFYVKSAPPARAAFLLASWPLFRIIRYEERRAPRAKVQRLRRDVAIWPGRRPRL